MAEDLETLSRRAEFLTDGVVAIAMTLLALDLRPDLPTNATSGQLAHFFREHSGEYYAFAIAFYLIGTYWRNHNRIMNNAKLGDELCVTLNLFFLFAITLVPLTAFIQGNFTTNLGRSIFAGNLAAVGLALAALQERLIQKGYADANDTELDRLRRRARFVMTLLILTLAGALPWVIGGQSDYLYLLTALDAFAAKGVAGAVENRRERRRGHGRRSPNSRQDG